jgi:hypothetical protein
VDANVLPTRSYVMFGSMVARCPAVTTLYEPSDHLFAIDPAAATAVAAEVAAFAAEVAAALAQASALTSLASALTAEA